uniref:Uncharacterized protein n=1 Tax=Arion vulgaris TaxID=1028688 RepID=A0A0B6XXK9_9EUPU
MDKKEKNKRSTGICRCELPECIGKLAILKTSEMLPLVDWLRVKILQQHHNHTCQNLVQVKAPVYKKQE